MSDIIRRINRKSNSLLTRCIRASKDAVFGKIDL